MAAIDDITALAQKVYYSINGSQNDDTGDDLTVFQDDFIIAFNLWKDEYETEAYWNAVRVDDYELGDIANTTTYSFELPEEYRTPVINQNAYLKFVSDGAVIAKFKFVDPNQRVPDNELTRPDRATFVGRNIILSRAPTEEEVGATMTLDVVEYIPDLTRKDATALDLIYSTQLAALGVAKNETLSDLTKATLSPSFAQKYANELKKALMINGDSTETDEMQSSDFSGIGGIW